ncbi:ABC transporter permease [Pseudoflavonifractor sp. HCP28S3_F10]|uniref:ABC transporter permease n=1 Tax=Pseudoflavonifractor sp. HCP28S3_F10 TaxID=3438947 RepID=UPI003F8BEB3B
MSKLDTATPGGAMSSEALFNREKKANSLWRKFCRNRAAVIGLVIVAFMVFIAVFSPLVAQQSPIALDLKNKLLPPLSPGHIFGTDEFGRDLFARIVYGARTSIIIAAGASVVGCLLGMIVGMIAGYMGGAVDSVLMRIVDGMFAFPSILLSIVLVTVLGNGALNVILALGISSLPRFARVVRGQVTILKNEEYCNAERVLGASHLRLMIVHILPNAMSPIIVYFTLNIASAILSEAGLSFLGLGIIAPTPSWGNILRAGNPFLGTAPHVAFLPGAFILLAVLGFNLTGDGIRDALDPKMKR